MNTRRARIVPAVNGWAIFAETGRWKGRGQIKTIDRWRVCVRNTCRYLATRKDRLIVHNKKWQKARIRLIVVAENKDGRVKSKSKWIKLNNKSRASSNSQCSIKGASIAFKIGTPGKRILKAHVRFGKEKV